MAQHRKNKTIGHFLKKFNLRTLLVSVTICCLLIGWYVVRSQNQRACVKSIIEKGGRVIYAYPYKSGMFDPQANPPGPKWLRDSLGLDFFDKVYGVDFSGQNISELPDLASVFSLQTLWLRNTNVADLAFVAQLSKLENLWIADTQVQSLAPISKNKKLKWISLERTKIQDLSPLAKLPELRTLNISGTSIPPEELKRFRAINPECAILGEND